jgi:hypothetical protein
MIVVIVALGVLFLGLGFLLNKKNARYLLSGYNMMSRAEREKMDLDAYIPFFRRFHVFLGTTFMVAGLVLHLWVSQSASAVFIAVYPLTAYMVFLWKGMRYSPESQRRKERLALYGLIGCLMLVGVLFVVGGRDNPVIFGQNTMTIRGWYGEEVASSDIDSVQLVDRLPSLKWKTNGYALGPVKKGYFKTRSGEVIKLIVDTDARPFIRFVRKKGRDIYYSSKSRSSETLLEEIRVHLTQSVISKPSKTQ